MQEKIDAYLSSPAHYFLVLQFSYGTSMHMSLEAHSVHLSTFLKTIMQR